MSEKFTTSCEFTTSCAKPIWDVVFDEKSGARTQKVLAWSLVELLSFFNENGHNKIIKIEKTKDEATYHY